MTNLTKEQLAVLEAQAKKILKRIENGEKTVDIMSGLYVDALEGKTAEQGAAVAETMIKTIEAFDINYEEACVDIDHFIRKFQHEIDRDKSCLEKCIYWKKFAHAINAISAQTAENGAVDMEKIMSEVQAITLTEEEATALLESELEQAAFEAIKDSDVFLGTLATNVELLEGAQDADEAVSLLVELKAEGVDYRAIVSMLAYINALKGEYPEVPVDVSPAEVATAVCVQTEQVKVIDAVSRGDVTLAVANALLGIIGIVGLCTLTATAVTISGVVIMAVFPSIFIAIPALLMVCYGIVRAFGSIGEAWLEDTPKIALTTIKIGRGFVNAVKSLFELAKGALRSARAQRAKQRMQQEATANTDEETLTNPALA